MSDKKIRLLPWVLIVICVAHLALLAVAVSDPEATLRFDRTGKRITSARLLLEAKGMAEVGPVLLTRGAPGDYVWHTLVLASTGQSLIAVQLVQLLLAALSLVAVHGIALALDGRREVALLATVLYAAIPIDFILPHFLASEAFFNPLLLFGVAALVRYATRAPDLRTIAAAGVAFGLAALTRPEALPWLIVMLAFAAALAMRVARKRMLLHTAVLGILTFAGVSIWLALTPAEPVALDRASLTLEWELANRANRVLSAAGGNTVGIEAAPLAAFCRSLVEHPLAFTREFVLQAGKLLALPDNLDTFRYLGFYEYTGRRAEWLHTLGVLGAARRAFAEMPGLATWLVVTIVVWLAIGVIALRGAAELLRRSEGVERTLSLLLLSLPVIWTLLRVLTQGESRKRSPVDFAITIFAAIGWLRARYTGPRPSRAHGGVA